MDRAEIMAWRRARRADLIALRMAWPADRYRVASAEISARLWAFLHARPEPMVGAYWPFRREFNVLAVLDALIAEGRAVALPVVLGKGMPLEFRRWTRATAMASGVYDIPYPAEGEAVQPGALIVPLVGFDAAGYRLGYGGGFYDRTLAIAPSKPLAIGAGFELSRLSTIYPLPHDIPMDYIVTEKALYRRGPGGLENA